MRRLSFKRQDISVSDALKGTSTAQEAVTSLGPSDELVAAAKNVSAQLLRDPLDAGPAAPNMNAISIFQTVRAADRAQVMKLAVRDTRAARAIGAMVGMAVGDAVGSPLEFIPVGQSKSSFDPRSMKVVNPCNRFKLKPGQWTDDTSMGLCLADSLLVRGTYDAVDIRVRFWNWWNRGYNNAFRLEAGRSGSVGLGGDVGTSLQDVKNSCPRPRFDSPNTENAGNGSLVRLAPMPVFFHADVDLAVEACAESSLTTHPGRAAADACGFLGFVTIRAILRSGSRGQTAKEFLDACVEAYVDRPETKGQELLMRLLRSSEPQGSKEILWNWRDPKGPFLKETVAARGSAYNGFPVSGGYMGGYSMDGLAMAMHSFYHTTSFTAALTRCVNLLGDADSTGSICGQIAGAFYGVSAVDRRMVANLNRWDGGEVALRGALLYALGARFPADRCERLRRGIACGWSTTKVPREEERPTSGEGAGSRQFPSGAAGGLAAALEESAAAAAEQAGSRERGAAEGLPPPSEEARERSASQDPPEVVSARLAGERAPRQRRSKGAAVRSSSARVSADGRQGVHQGPTVAATLGLEPGPGGECAKPATLELEPGPGGECAKPACAGRPAADGAEQEAAVPAGGTAAPRLLADSPPPSPPPGSALPVSFLLPSSCAAP